jgi:uncharacterized damage-inducible protein DinB
VTPDESIRRLEQSVNRLLEDIQRLPGEVLYRAPEPGEWPVMSTLAHLAEMLPYWAHQAEGIARDPGKPFGRSHDDQDRIDAVEQHGRDSLDAIVPRIRASLDECERALRTLPSEAWTAAGVHPTRGSMTVEQLVESFLVKHADEHARQTQRTLQALSAARN